MELKPGYKQTEVGVIPSNWDFDKLEKYWNVIDCKHITARFIDDGIPLASITEVQSLFVDLKNAMQTTDFFYNKLIEGGRKPIIGDLIFSRNATVGEVAQVAKWHPPFAMGQDVCLLRKRRPNSSTTFLQAVIKSAIIVKQLELLMVGSTFKRVNIEQIRSFIIPFPSPHEQTAIATALSDTDQYITHLEKLIAKKRNIKQGAMQELLKPKEGWVVKKLGEIAEIYQPQTISQDVFVHDGFLVYGANGIVGMYDKYNHETWQTTITCRGSTCGTVNRTIGKCWITGNAMVMNVDKNTSTDKLFFYYLLTKQDFSKCITGSGQPQIVRTPIKEFEISMPREKSEQNNIAAILSDMDSEITTLETKLSKAKSIKQGMMQQLLTGKIRLI